MAKKKTAKKKTSKRSPGRPPLFGSRQETIVLNLPEGLVEKLRESKGRYGLRSIGDVLMEALEARSLSDRKHAALLKGLSKAVRDARKKA